MAVLSALGTVLRCYGLVTAQLADGMRVRNPRAVDREGNPPELVITVRVHADGQMTFFTDRGLLTGPADRFDPTVEAVRRMLAGVHA